MERDYILDALDEQEWRYNNRENEYLFRDTLIRLVEADPMEYKELTQELVSESKA